MDAKLICETVGVARVRNRKARFQSINLFAIGREKSVGMKFQSKSSRSSEFCILKWLPLMYTTNLL
jgi:hypothetical protein